MSVKKAVTVDHPGHIDELGRMPFARQLLSLVVHVEAMPRGVVVGLEGEWGSGKTSVLKQLESLVEGDNEGTRVILVHFNPWMVSGTPGLVEALLLQMAAELQSAEQAQRKTRASRKGSIAAGAAVAGAIVRYAGVLSVVKHFAPAAGLLVPGAGLVLDGIAHAAEMAAGAVKPIEGQLNDLARQPAALSLLDARKAVEKALAELKRRIVVVVDDIDRLPPTEMAAMVQAVKAVADFPNVVYVLAYDPAVVARAIRSALRVGDGRAFLEKIVQVPVPLPHPPARRLQQYAIRRLAGVLDDASSLDEAGDIDQAWPLLAAMLRSPRDIERLRTRLLICFPLLRDEVNLADVALLEGFALVVPGLITWLSANPAVLMRAGLRQFDRALSAIGTFGDIWADIELVEKPPSEQDAKKRKASWEKVVPKEANLLVPVRAAMKFLFDETRGWGHSAERGRSRRVQDFRFWLRWRCFHDGYERWPHSELLAMLADSQQMRSSGMLTDERQFVEFCQEVCDLGTDNVKVADPTGPARLFVEAEENFAFSTDFNNGDSMGYGPRRALETIIRAAPLSTRASAISDVIGTGSVWLACALLHTAWLDLKPDRRETPAALLVEDLATLGSLRSTVLDRARAALAEPTFPPRQEVGPYDLLNWLSLLGADVGDLRQLATAYIDSSPAKLLEFFSGQSDKPNYEAFPLEVKWTVLPDAATLATLMKQEPGFGKTHLHLSRLVEKRLARAPQEPGAASH